MRAGSIGWWLMLAAAVAAPGWVHGLQQAQEVRMVASDTLRDVAMTAYDAGRPVIYYNPALLQRIGPRLATFFLAHEYGHVSGGHAGAALAFAPGGSLRALRQRQELDADCYAARMLAQGDREAVETAIRFFTRVAAGRLDALHPTGSQRAAKILACLPGEAPAIDNGRTER